jgi:DNA-binding HxlR family transcriptional regulator
MALPNDYAGQACSLARSLEIIGERWTLLIVRDAFWGVRRFADFLDDLQLPRAVLASRLKTLTAAGVMTRVAGERHLEYELTEKGRALWPVVLSLTNWGDDFCAPGGPRRLFRHAADDGQVDRWGRCDRCGTAVPAADTIVVPGPGLEPPDDSRVATALTRPHRLLEPLRPAGATAAPLLEPTRPAGATAAPLLEPTRPAGATAAP